MKKLLNQVERVELEMLQGIAKAHPQYLKKLPDYNVLVRAQPKTDKVALVSGGGDENRDEFIGPWVDVARHALEKADEDMPGACAADRARACELWNVRLSLRNLLSFPWVKSAVEEGRLFLHGWYFDLQSGELLEYDDIRGDFHPLVGRPHLHTGQGGVPAGKHS